MILRPYQEDAVNAVYHHLRTEDDNPCVVIPTAGGKTPAMATICRDAVDKWGGRVLILAHVKELLKQTAKHLNELLAWGKVGVYSAGLRQRDTGHPVIVAGIQSVYKKAGTLGAFDLIIIDEAHLIPPDGEGMYRTFLTNAKIVNPNVRIIGLTATPFRMSSGSICEPDNILNRVCYEVGVRELIVQGYLCKIRSKAGRKKADISGLHVRGGEFIPLEVSDLMNTDELVNAACREIVDYTKDRKATLIFAAGVDHAKHVASVLRNSLGAEIGEVYGETLTGFRDQTIEDFKAGRLKYLVNVNVLTTGFDAPNIDCIAMLRPTLSPGLYYQMVGRGFRLCEGKDDCLVLDFGDNITTHGPIDDLKIKKGHGSGSDDSEAPAKECPECLTIIAAGYGVCPDCGYEFPPPESQSHQASATEEAILSGEISEERHELGAANVWYEVHTKHDAADDAPKTMKVVYAVTFAKQVNEFICVEHKGYARYKAEQWWQRRSKEPVPATAAEAVRLANGGALAETKAIVVKSISGERFDNITGYVLGAVPTYREAGWEEPGEQFVSAVVDDQVPSDDDIPF